MIYIAGLDTLQAIDIINKLNSHKIQNLMAVLCHLGCNIEGTNLRVSGESVDAILLANFTTNNYAEQSEEDARDESYISNCTDMFDINK